MGLDWPNEDYVKPSKPTTRGGRAKQMNEIRKGVEEKRKADKKALAAPHAYVGHDAPSTSVRAADVSAVRNSHRRKQVLAAIRALGDATDDEVCLRINDPDQHAGRVASRRLELQESGWVEPLVTDGRPVERRTRTGAEAQVWTLTSSARVEIQGVDLPSI